MHSLRGHIHCLLAVLMLACCFVANDAIADVPPYGSYNHRRKKPKLFPTKPISLPAERNKAILPENKGKSAEIELPIAVVRSMLKQKAKIINYRLRKSKVARKISYFYYLRFAKSELKKYARPLKKGHKTVSLLLRIQGSRRVLKRPKSRLVQAPAGGFVYHYISAKVVSGLSS